MRKLAMVCGSLASLISLAAVDCFGMQAPSAKVTLDVKGDPLSVRSMARPSHESDQELQQKGYIRIGTVSMERTLAPSDADKSRNPLPAIVAENERLMLSAAAAAGGDLVGKLEPKMDDKFDTYIAPHCREEAIQGRATEIRTVDKYGYTVDSRYVYAKNEIVTRCFPTLEKDLDKFLGYSWKAQATVWRLEPGIASQLLAASEGNEAAIRALEAYGFPVPTIGLIEAIKGGDVFRVTELLNHGARLDALLPDAKAAKDYKSRHATPLHWAALAGQTQVARLLLERGADVSARDDADQTAMQYANCYFYTDKDKTRSLTQLLLAHGANPNVDCYSGRTPLWLAANNGDVELVRDLLAHGADRSPIADRYPQQPRGQTALDRAKSQLEFEKKWGKKDHPSTTATRVAHYNQIIALLSSTVTPAKPNH